MEVEERTIAGQEGRVFYRMQIVPPLGQTAFSQIVPAFDKLNLVLGRGITSTRIPETRSYGKILDYRLEPAVNTRATLLVENLAGGLTVGESLYQTDYSYSGQTGPRARISYITEGVSGMSSVYDNTWRMRINWDGTNYFTTSTFSADQLISSLTGASASTAFARGYVIDYTVLTGSTQCNIRILQQGESGFAVGQSLAGAAGFGPFAIAAVLNEPDIDLYSGQIHYIQNIKPIDRDEDQKEEIKLIIKI